MPVIEKLDAKGWICPMPVLRAMKYLRKMEQGDILEVEVNDNKSVTELQKYCDESGNILQSMAELEDNYLIKIQKNER